LFVFFERIDAIDLPLGYIARGRYALFNGSIEDAKTNVLAAEKIKPDLYEIPLLKSEIAIKLNDITTAKNLLNALSSDLGAAAWIRDFANQLLQTIP
jgi:uncharacterized protein HemY